MMPARDIVSGMYSGHSGCLQWQEQRVSVVLDELDVLLERLVSSWGYLDG